MWLRWLGSFFLHTKKKFPEFQCAYGAHAGNGLRRLESQGAAGLKKRLPVLPTARWRALDRGGVVAVARLLFFAYKKKFQCAYVQGAGATYLDRLATGNEIPNGSGAGPAVARPGSGAGPAVGVARPGSDAGSDAGTIETGPSMPDARLRFWQNITLS